MPFVVELPPELLSFGSQDGMDLNRLTVAVNGTLTHETIPQGQWKADGWCRAGSFYKFAGIHGSVFLYTTPMTFIDDVSVITDYNSTIHTGRSLKCFLPSYCLPLLGS